jgi:hypothetical protein
LCAGEDGAEATGLSMALGVHETTLGTRSLNLVLVGGLKSGYLCLVFDLAGVVAQAAFKSCYP